MEVLERKSSVKPEYVKPLLKLLLREGFEKLVSVREKLKALGMPRDYEIIDYGLVLGILS